MRTPLARRIDSDASLNNISLFLPYFDKETVDKVIKTLQDKEMAALAEIGTSKELVTLKRDPSLADVFDAMSGLTTYRIDSARKLPPLRLYMGLARALTMDGIDLQAQRNAKNAIIAKMTEEVNAIKASGNYETRAEGITGISMGGLAFNYGETTYTYDEESDSVEVTEFDIRRHFEQTGKILGEGLHTEYWIKHSDRDELDVWIEVIVLVNDGASLERLGSFAESEFYRLYEKHKYAIGGLSEMRKQVYAKLISSSPRPLFMPWELPLSIDFTVAENSVKYGRHLYVNSDGEMEISLGTWEADVLEEELMNGAVCWLRNLDRRPWSLCLPYKVNGVFTPMYPDLLIVRAVSGTYIFDILEPHDDSRKDNCPKAIGLAEFAEKHWDKFGRIELIRKMKGPDNQMHYYRLDLGKLAIRNKVRGIRSNAELDRIFEEDAVREDI